MKRITVGTLTPLHQLPTGHERKRSESVMRHKNARKGSRSSRKARGWE
jgi:hypothetical protein